MEAVGSTAANTSRASMAIAPEATDDVTIEMDGVFDGATALKLRERLDAARHLGKRIVLDFSKVSELRDFGMGVLAHGLAERAASLPRVSLRGLRTHQLRMLRYLGVDAET